MLDAMLNLGRRQVTMCEVADVLAKEKATDVYREIKHCCTSLLLLPLLLSPRNRFQPPPPPLTISSSGSEIYSQYTSGTIPTWGLLVSDPIPPGDDIRT